VRVLGVDPGLTRCGMGVVDAGPGNRLCFVDVVVVCTPPGDAIGLRLAQVAARAEDWLERFQPDAVAVERVFSQHNVRTVMGTAQVAGVILAAAGRRGLPVALHTPTEVKAAVTGSGRADKNQVATMVARLLHLPANPVPADAADALALAICHLWRAPGAVRGAAG
jgi:crossover junction endodeoxyribonuclease RuvC